MSEAVAKKVDNIEAMCANCHARHARFHCGGCKITKYCGKKCQTQHWKSQHKKQCKILQHSLSPTIIIKTSQAKPDIATKKLKEKPLHHASFDEHIICGFLRDVINNQFDYSIIFSCIESYYVEGYAKYYDYSSTSKNNLHFGDIIKIAETSQHNRHLNVSRKTGSKYKMVDINGQLVDIGTKHGRYCCKFGSQYRYFYQIKIPFLICKYLFNAPKFFAEFDKENEFNERVMRYRKLLILKHDDKYIMETFGGALNPIYRSITMMCVKRYNGRGNALNESIKFEIDFNGRYKNIFDLADFDYTNEDIEQFYQLRKDKNDLTKIKVEGDKYSECKCFSSKWNCLAKYSCYSKPCFTYVGPKSEQKKMLGKLQRFYGKSTIKIVMLNDNDWCSNTKEL